MSNDIAQHIKPLKTAIGIVASEIAQLRQDFQQERENRERQEEDSLETEIQRLASEIAQLREDFQQQRENRERQEEENEEEGESEEEEREEIAELDEGSSIDSTEGNTAQAEKQFSRQKRQALNRSTLHACARDLYHKHKPRNAKCKGPICQTCYDLARSFEIYQDFLESPDGV